MSPSVDVVVRPLAGEKGLEGAFRLHLQRESLDQAALELGDRCEIVDESGDGILGYGIAWRATDSLGSGNPKIRPVKASETFRNCFDIQEGSRVTIRKSSTDLETAKSIVLRKISSEHADNEKVENRQWQGRCRNALYTADAFAVGAKFDIAPKKGMKKRFEVEQIDGSASSCHLYNCDDSTEVHITTEKADPTRTSTTRSVDEPVLDLQHIGGLVDQVQRLNALIALTLRDHKDPNARLRNHGIILHGFQGTGKTHILQQLRDAPVRKVLWLENSGLSPSKMKDHVADVIKAAKSHQPSLVLVDELDTIAPTTNKDIAATLASQIDQLGVARVAIVASARRLLDIDEKLLRSGRLSKHIELPVPDENARRHILDILMGRDAEATHIAGTMAARTHGYTGADLQNLFDRAIEYSDLRVVARGAGVPDGSQNGTSTKVATNGDGHETMDTIPQPTLDDFMLALRHTRPTALKEIIFEPPKIGWADIGGSTDIKRRFDETVDWSIHHSDERQSWRLQPEKGILLYGPPGCSKTMTAQAVASHYGLNFVPVKGAELINMYVGESERAVRELFRKAKAAAPCIIFFDEIDSIAAERDSGASKGLNVLTTLLNEMDGFDTLKNVLVLAATNKPGALDPAILRPGRFGTHIYLGPPDAAARREVITMRLRGIPLDEHVQVDTIVDMSEGCSGAEIIHACEEAMNEAWRRPDAGDARVLRMEDLTSVFKNLKRSITEDMLAEYRAFQAV